MEELMKKFRDGFMRLNLYASVGILVVEVLVLVAYVLTDMIGIPLRMYVWLYVILPATINIGVVFLGSHALKRRELSDTVKNVVPLLTQTVIISCVVVAHHAFAATYCLFMLPICMSAVYGDVRIESRVYALCCAALALSLFAARFDGCSPLPSKVAYEVAVAFVGMLLTHLFVRCVIRFEQDEKLMLESALEEIEELDDQASRDGLTGLYNIRALTKICEEWIESRSDLAFCMLDIDDFKKVNDAYGHEFGNVVLRRLAGILMGYRSKDVVVARYGGEEFAILMSGTSELNAVELADSVRVNFRHQTYRETDKHFRLSGGVAMYESGQSVGDFFASADSNLYHAKRTGKDRVVSSMLSKQ